MDALLQFIDVFLHLDVHLNEWAGALGPWLYVVLFVIVFCETGLVVTPVPAGRLAALRGRRAVPRSRARRSRCLLLLAVLLIVAAILGDAVNYAIGR